MQPSTAALAVPLPSAARSAAPAAPGTRTATATDQVLDSAAGFFGSAAAAQQALQCLALMPGLLPAHLLLLRPADAAWPLFTLHARGWACRARYDGEEGLRDVGLLACLGALLAGLGSAMSLSLGGSLALGAVLLFCLLAALAGAAAGACTAGLWRQPPHLRRFAAIVRGQLAAGRWVVVLHGVPWQRQARSLALVREHSVDWCAVSVAQRAL